MGNKNGFDPAVVRGIHRFEHLGKWATVCFFGSVLEGYRYGDPVFFQNQYGKFWLGTVERDGFFLILEKPLDTVLEGLYYLSIEDSVHQLHDLDGWFCEQGELPF